MGRVKLQFIKRITHKLMDRHKNEFKNTFAENKEIIKEYLDVSNKKLRNIITGYVTRLMKKTEKD